MDPLADLDGSVPFDVGEDGHFTLLSAQLLGARRLERLQHDSVPDPPRRES